MRHAGKPESTAVRAEWQQRCFLLGDFGNAGSRRSGVLELYEASAAFTVTATYRLDCDTGLPRRKQQTATIVDAHTSCAGLKRHRNPFLFAPRRRPLGHLPISET